MKTVFFLSTLGLSLTSLACPTMSGAYKCTAINTDKTMIIQVAPLTGGGVSLTLPDGKIVPMDGTGVPATTTISPTPNSSHTVSHVSVCTETSIDVKVDITMKGEDKVTSVKTSMAFTKTSETTADFALTAGVTVNGQNASPPMALALKCSK